MALPSPSFIVGLLVTLYLSTFVLFAIIRIVTGVSIQRLGFTSLRRIAYTPRDGVRIDIRGLGLQIHRPTFAQPTWISLVVTELKVSLDLVALRSGESQAHHDASNGHVDAKARQAQQVNRKSKKNMWMTLTDVKDRIKRLHHVIVWIRLFDFVAHKSTLVVNEIGTLQIGSVIVSVDTRRATVDRTRIFKHNRSKGPRQTPAEWTVDIRSILFTPESQDSIEILDHGQLKIHGFLKPDVAGLRDVALAVKLGRLYIPYDDFVQSSVLARSTVKSDDGSVGSARERPSTPAVQDAGSEPEDGVLKSVIDARGFISSTLRGIHEVSFAASFVGMSKRLDFIRPTGNPVYVNVAMKEFGLDLYRLDPLTPAHSMYFEKRDIAHQVLLSAISIALGIEDGLDHPERLLYIPMTTATIKTTLPAKILQYAAREEPTDRNTNVLFANLVITSPSIDCDPHHLPLLMAILEQRSRGKKKSSSNTNPGIVQQLLPRSTLRLSVHEPVIRVALPTTYPEDKRDFDFDLLISDVSSVSLDIDSSHTVVGEKTQYSLTSALRIASHRLYYQNAMKERYNLMLTDEIELKSNANSSPSVSVSTTGNIRTFTLFLVRPEIFRGIQQITKQLRSEVQSDKISATPKTETKSSLRKLPDWLKTFKFEASDFNVEIAALDEKLSTQPRGFALHMDSLTAEYKIRRDYASAGAEKQPKSPEHSRMVGDVSETLSPPAKLRKPTLKTDGRRLAVHLKGFEGFTIEADKTWDDEPFMQLPKAEVAFTTTSDGYGPMLHLNSFVKGILVQYSLFRHYCIGVAVCMLQTTFSRGSQGVKTKPIAKVVSTNGQPIAPGSSETDAPDLIVVDAKVTFVQIKAIFPSEPRLMMHFQELEAAKHRWTTPHVRAQIIRLSCDSPTVPGCWNRIIGIKNPRIDLRENRRRIGHGPNSGPATVERSIDIVADAIRIGVPHGLVVHNIFSNVVNTMKTAQQLHHRFVTGSDEYILAKAPEGPKRIPRVTVRSHVFLFEIEDGAFEWKLGVIFRTGLAEQKQRLAREEAFRLKERVLLRTKSGRGRQGKPTVPASTEPEERPQSPESDERGRSARGRWRNRRSRSSLRPGSERGPVNKDLRYDADGKCAFTDEAKISIDEARERLDKYNSDSWKKRVDRAMSHTAGAIAEMRSMIWGIDAMPEYSLNERVLQMPKRPALMSILMSDLSITIDKPSFPMEKLPDFMYDIGKGIPKDTFYGLLVPLGAHFDIGEARVTLRDYPLPILHIPPIKAGQAPRLPSWSLKTDFVIAEEFRDSKSTRDLQVMVIPPDKLDPGKKSGGFAIDVRRTVSPVKTYSTIKIDINTARDTRITWGSSYQPAIQDMMQVMEGFTKPQIDPSPRVGFWDKIRLSFHSRVSVDWKGGGDVHLMLKGARDPYVVTGHGAGLVMVWRNDVRLNVWQHDDPQSFMTVESGDYILAIPDFASQARSSPHLVSSQAQGSSSLTSNHEGQKFKKVVMKLSGKVKWQLGLVFERTTFEGTQSFSFRPHYEVTLKNPMHVKDIKDQPEYDAFRGFRSNFIHMSIGISAPSDRDWKSNGSEQSSNYNSVHLSPRFFTHFFAWWSMFSGIMSLPIHQGKLWPGVQKSGKKFGRHLGTVKYSLMLSPLFISHVYKHKDAEEYSESESQTAVTGLKVKLKSFIVDLHQRREEFDSEVKGLNKTVKTSGMKINQVLLDLIDADIRAVSALISIPDVDSVLHASNAKLAEYEETKKNVDLSDFEIPDNDFSWIDVDDFVEVDWTLPIDSDPTVKILPLAGAPRFTYRRQTDHNNTISGDPNRYSRFGYEPTHDCVMNTQDDSRQVQIDIIQERIQQIKEMKETHDRNMGEFELKLVRDGTAQEELQQKLQDLQQHSDILEHKNGFLNRMVEDLRRRMANHDLRVVADPEELDKDVNDIDAEQSEPDDADTNRPPASDFAKLDSSALADHVSDFNNRFVIHNAKIKWNNSLRNIMLRYIHQVSQRRGFVYYTSRKAVKFILDIVEEQRQRGSLSTSMQDQSESESVTPISPDDDIDVQDRIDQLLRDGKRFVNADDPDGANPERQSQACEKAHDDVSQDFAAMNTYHLRLVAPQIQLQSEKNAKSAVVLTARGMRLKVIQIMDKERMSDDVSGLVQRRFSMDMDNLQFFVTNKATFSTDHLHMYSGSRYGAADGSFWPPWVPIEVMFDFTVPSLGFKRVVQRTSAGLRYDKYNNLRLKYNDSVSDGKSTNPDEVDESRMDHLWVEFPQLRAICDSSEYFSLYTIVVDLLMWSEPLEKVRNERLEKIMLAADFSDLRGAPEIVTTLQDRIRQLEEIKTHFHIHEKYLDRRGWRDRITLEQDLAACEDELFFIMKAITTSQRKLNERADTSKPVGLLKWFVSANEIVWHLTKEEEQPLAEFQLGNVFFERTDNSDGSNQNSVEIDKIRGLSLLPNAIYPEIVGPFKDVKNPTDDTAIAMFRVNWHMLEAIAGIPIVDHFEVNLHPLKVQLEYETGKQLFSYIFPGKGQGDDSNTKSPFLVKHQPVHSVEEEDEEALKEYNRRRVKAVRESMNQRTGSATGAGSLESRLTPTLTLPDADSRPSSSTSHHQHHKHKGLGLSMSDSKSNLNGGSSKSRSPSTSSRVTGRASTDSRSARGRDLVRTNTNETTTTTGKKTRFSLTPKTQRSTSQDSRSTRRRNSDDLSQMMDRASNYMTLAYAKLPSMVLCLSYKGRGARNVEDVHDLVFRMPTLEYRNKTWSNLDLAMALKRDIIRALVHHTGTIISNKFSHRKPGAHQASRLRELASSSVVLSSSSDINSVPRSSSTSSRATGWLASHTNVSGSHVSLPTTTDTEIDSSHPDDDSESSIFPTNRLSPQDSIDSGFHTGHLVAATTAPPASNGHAPRPRTAEHTGTDKSSVSGGSLRDSGQIRQSLHRHFSDLRERARNRREASSTLSTVPSEATPAVTPGDETFEKSLSAAGATSGAGGPTSAPSVDTANGGTTIRGSGVPALNVQPATPIDEIITPPRRRETIKKILKKATHREGSTGGMGNSP